MDLKKEFLTILKKYGHNVYLVRRTNLVGSGPYNKVDGKYKEVLEKYTAYRRPLRAGANAAADGFMRLNLEGLVTSYDMCFYFEPEASVSTADIILEDTPGEITPRQEFEVKKSIPYYLGAEHIYTAAYCDKMIPTQR